MLPPWMTSPEPRRQRFGQQAGLATVIVLLWAAIILPSLVQSYTAPKYRLSTGDDAPFSPLAGATNTLITLALTGLLVLVIVRAVPHLPTDRYAPLAIMLLPWFWQAGRDVYADTSLKFGGLIYPLLVFTVWALRPQIRQLAVLGYLVGLTAALSLAMGALTPAKGILSHAAGDAVTPDKQILPWGILIGPLTDGNPLGQFLALGAPAVMFIPRRGIRYPGLAAVVLAVVWTSNRSSLIALAVGLAFAGALALIPRAGRKQAVIAALTLGLALVVVLPLTVTSDAQYTNRGYIWRSSLLHWQEHPLVGLGSQWYSLAAQYADNIGATAFHGHNQFVQSLVLGGLVNVALVGLVLFFVVRAAGDWASRRNLVIPAAMLSMFVVSSCFEVTLGFVHRSFLLPIVLLPMAYVMFGSDDRAEPAAEGEGEGEGEAADPVAPAAWPATQSWTVAARAPEQVLDVTADDLWSAGGWLENAKRRTTS